MTPGTGVPRKYTKKAPTYYTKLQKLITMNTFDRTLKCKGLKSY